MPEISSSTSSPTSSSNLSTDPTLDDAGLICRSDVISSPPPPPPPSLVSEPPPKPPAVAKLMSVAAPPPAALPPSSAPASTANNNAERTSEGSGISGYAEYGVTGSGDALFAGVAALKGRDPATGIDVEVFSASKQVGLQNEEQVGMARVGFSGQNGAASGELFTLRRNLGIHNDDGSTGFNIGAGATIVGGEGTVTDGADSLTLGVSAGPSLGFSVGIRDLDDNGSNEWCAKVSAGPVTVGGCWEGS